ncbi:hypothetical protein [Psychrobacter sp. AOP31-A1-22]|uniref:hypothetical protein n=1 Tax=Psychrobacter sp. AOP31-A1-22 TaxID=3457696 RepID=UPI004036987C
MSSLVWQQPGLATLMGMSMSDNKPTNANEIKQASEVASAKLTSRPQTNAPGMRSSIPAMPGDYEEAFVDERGVSETRSAQLKRLLSSTWLRLVLIAAAVTLVLAFIFIFRSVTDSGPMTVDGRSSSSSVQVNKKLTGKENLNSQQAEYLMDKRRQDAAAKAASGESSAAIIELPRATVADANMAEQSEVAFGQMNITNRYNTGNNAATATAAATGEKGLDLSNTGRYQDTGSYYVDKEANSMVITPEIEAQMRASANAEKAASDSQSPANATLNTSQQNDGNQGQYNSNDGSGNNNGGGNNSGGDNGAGTGAEQQVQQREPDADLPLIQQRLYSDYDRQLQEQEMYQNQLNAQIERNRAAAAASQRERSRQAQQSLGNQLRDMERQRQGTSGFSSKPYIPTKPKSNGNGNGEQAPQNPMQPQSDNFVRSAYSTSTRSTEPVKGESSPRPGLLPRNVIRAGTSWPVVVTKSVNTDEGLQIIAQVMDGPFVGSEVYGIVQQTGRDIGVSFTRIVPPNPRKPIIPVNAMALTIGSQKQAVSSDKKGHYLQNYSVMAAESVIEGYGDAYADQNTSTIIQSDGTVITSKGKTTSKEVQGNILSQFADRLNNDIGRLGNRAPTYYVRQGSVLQMKLLTNLDRNQVADDIAGQTQGQL